MSFSTTLTGKDAPRRLGQDRHRPSWVAGGVSRLAIELERLGARRAERWAVSSTRMRGYGVFDAGVALVRYRTLGKGRPVVFATDPPIVIEQYDELFSELSADHLVTVVELPGFGFSPVHSGYDHSIAAASQVMAAFLDALGQGPCVLAFPCGTAYCALSIANERPDLVSALVLAQAPSWSEELAWKARRDPRGVLSTPILGQIALRATARRRAPSWFKTAAGSPHRREQFIETTSAAFQNGAMFSLASAFQRWLVGAPSLAPARVPTLFVWGLRDHSHSSTDRRSSLTLAPEGRIVETPTVGHFPELENPAWFGRVLREFLGEMVAHKPTRA